MESLTAMNLNQLQQTRENLRKEVMENQARFTSMSNALMRYQDSLQAIETISKSEENNKLLVPVTETMFIPGKVANTSHVMVEIGTGFFVRRSVSDARSFCERKINNLKTYADRVGENTMALKNNLSQVEDVMRFRVQQVKESQEAAAEN